MPGNSPRVVHVDAVLVSRDGCAVGCAARGSGGDEPLWCHQRRLPCIPPALLPVRSSFLLLTHPSVSCQRVRVGQQEAVPRRSCLPHLRRSLPRRARERFSPRGPRSRCSGRDRGCGRRRCRFACCGCLAAGGRCARLALCRRWWRRRGRRQVPRECRVWGLSLAPFAHAGSVSRTILPPLERAWRPRLPPLEARRSSTSAPKKPRRPSVRCGSCSCPQRACVCHN